jgi:hypothetical protein
MFVLQVKMLRLNSWFLFMLLLDRFLLEIKTLEVILIPWLDLPAVYHIDEQLIALILLESFTDKALHHVGSVAKIKYERILQGLASLNVSNKQDNMNPNSSLFLKYSLEE